MSPDTQGPKRKKQRRSLTTRLSTRIVLLAIVVGLFGIGYYSFGNSNTSAPTSAANGSKGLIVGSRLYSSYCTSCHGYSVETLKSTVELQQMLSQDQPAGNVHNLSDILSDDDSKALAEYVIANQGLSSQGNTGIGGSASTAYMNNCAGCHGPRGDQLPGANLVSKGFWERRDTNEDVASLAQGVKGMPAFGKVKGGQLTDDEIREIIRSLKALAQADSANQAPNDRQAEASRLYANICATCHGQKGSLLARYDLSSKDFWQSAGDKNLTKSVLEGKGGMPPLGQGRGGTLTDSQAETIIAVLKTKAIEGAKNQAQATPTKQQSDQKPQRPSAPLDSQHNNDWLRNHSSFVMESGAGNCYKCHANKYCVECHIKR